jgi:glutaredoxin 3
MVVIRTQAKGFCRMRKVEIYTSPFCGFCHRAKAMMTPGARKEMSARAGGASSVPQVFVDGEHIGDCEGIHDLDAEGKLDGILGVAS